MKIRHNPRCAIFREPPSLRDANDCDCGAIPPLPTRRPVRVDDLVEVAMFAVFGEDSAIDPSTGESLESDWARHDRAAVKSRLQTYLTRHLEGLK